MKMHLPVFYRRILFFIFCLKLLSSGAPFHKAQITDFSSNSSDDYVKIWIFFDSKENLDSAPILSTKSLARRSAVKFTQDMDDLPLDINFINIIRSLGGELENVYKWGNSASFWVPVKLLPELARLPFVNGVTPVPVYTRKTFSSGFLNKSTAHTESVFPNRKIQLDALNVLQARAYLSKKKKGILPGEGIFIGFFDSGFRLDHVCFDHLRKNSRIKAMHDFVDGDNDPQDSDSLLNHGATVLAQVAGYDPGTFTGVAWNADIALARTEISERETHIEEDNWVAALVWAESLGVDIVSSSLGYAVDFEDSVLIENRYFKDYPFSSLDGHSTIVSHAAACAVKRGMLIINAVGNEGSGISGTLNAPADVDGVVSVGSINSRGFISLFSSTGPAADGRIKPDCVAPGEDIVVPGFKVRNSYLTTFSGTSYAAPLVSGVVALIIQSIGKPYIAANVVNKLYKSCIFAKGQTEVDNQYGRGIPDALTAIMDSNELFIETTDSSGFPVAGVTLCTADNSVLGVTDSLGVICLKIEDTDSLFRLISLWDTVSVSVGKLPSYKRVMLSKVAGVTIKIFDGNKNPVSDCNVEVRAVNDQLLWNLKTSVNGEVRFIYSKQTELEITAHAKGYFSSGTVKTYLTSEENAVLITLAEIPDNSFILYPTVVKKDDRFVTLVLSCGLHSGTSDVIASVYSVSGKLVWSERKQTQCLEPIVFKWECRDSHSEIVPGMYYALLKHGKKTYKRKMLIAG